MIDFESLFHSSSDDAPCGPDLEAEGDLDYMNLMARIEGDLPASFFSFDRASIDIKAETAALTALLERSLDARPVAFLAKLAILGRDTEAFAGWLAALDDLLSTHWAHLHPAVADGQGALRSAVLQSLDDMPTVILPLQYAPLFNSRRVGAISFRSHLVASGEVARRDGEPEIDAASLQQALASVEVDELTAVSDTLTRITASISGIRKTWIAKGGFDDAPSLERLTKLSDRMLQLVAAELGRRAPAEAAVEAQSDPEPAGDDAVTALILSEAGRPVPSIGSARMAAIALYTIARYLAAAEPSNPALLLVLQAQRLVGRSFAEIAQIVMPDAFDDARIAVGADQQFRFRLDRLPEVDLSPEPESEEDDGEDPTFTIKSRRDVQTTLDQIAVFYRRAEPSNPIPLVCEKARDMCNLDFLTLMRDMLPKG